MDELEHRDLASLRPPLSLLTFSYVTPHANSRFQGRGCASKGGGELVPVTQWVPEHEYLHNGTEEVIYLDHGNSGEFIRGAVKGS